MKTLVLALALSLVPVAVSAQTAPESDSITCNMERLYTSILTRAKGQFEAVIKSSLSKKFGAVSYNITEKIQITQRENVIHNDDPGPNTETYTDYLLKISEVRIETPKGNILTLNVPALVLRSEEAKRATQYDDEGAFLAETCSAMFVGEVPTNTTIINAATQALVTQVETNNLGVSGFEVIKSK